MSGQDTYVMLIASLPSSEALFLAKKPPLSRLKLEARLRVLEPEDATVLHLVEETLNWNAFPMDTSDEEVVRRARRAVATIESPTLRDLIRDRLEMRTALAALRRRAAGGDPPAPGRIWGFGRWTGHIARHWNDPAFGLDGPLPWLREAAGLFDTGDAVGLERLILRRSHTMLQRYGDRHTFDLEAVVIYVLKWNIFDRWTRANAHAAVRRFEDLTEAGLADYASLSFEGEA